MKVKTLLQYLRSFDPNDEVHFQLPPSKGSVRYPVRNVTKPKVIAGTFNRVILSSE